MSQHYRVVTANTPEQLDEAVEKLLNTGWWIQGGVSVCAFPLNVPPKSDEHGIVSATIFAQAMWRLKANKAAVEPLTRRRRL